MVLESVGNFGEEVRHRKRIALIVSNTRATRHIGLVEAENNQVWSFSSINEALKESGHCTKPRKPIRSRKGP